MNFMEEKRQQMQQLIDELNAASEAYYGGKEEIMSNYEWDMKFDQLAKLEEETGIILPDSPTQNVSDSVLENNGQKETHEFPALSLAKTKKIADLQKWAAGYPVWLSWKLDGLTLVLTYDNGQLIKILTRGNGIIGTNITFMKEAIKGFPLTIPYLGHMVVRGEATISYPEFETINANIEDESARYANPRNLASGTLALDIDRLEEVKARHVTFNAFTLVHIDEPMKSWGARMDYLDSLGFTTVDRELTNYMNLPDTVEKWTKRVDQGHMNIPVDGLVIAYDDTDYAATGSVTGHHATRAGFAFKWQDQSAITTLRDVEWSCGATTITPVAIFDPVQLEGTTVSRASLANISEMERLGIGNNGETEVEVIKANKIIPKIISVPRANGKFTVPCECPACCAPTKIIVGSNGAKTLRCENKSCPAKHLKKYEKFVSKQGMDIDGLSIETLRTFIEHGFIHDFSDIFELKQHRTAIEQMDGFGAKSCDNLLSAISKAKRNVDPIKFITALSIPQIGGDAAKRIITSLGWSGFLASLETHEPLDAVDGIGPERSRLIHEWYADDDNRQEFRNLLDTLDIIDTPPAEKENAGALHGLTFVITGDVYQFKNRSELKKYIESRDGKVAGSVSSKTDYLINNDVTSSSSKNVKAKSLGIPIISEEDFIRKFSVVMTQ